MELIKPSECKTLEEYRAYQRQQSKLWYQKNREKKIKYQLDRYYSRKSQVTNID